MDAVGVARAHAHDVGHEDERSHLQRHLLANLPQLARGSHRGDQVLEGGRVSAVVAVGVRSDATHLLEDVVGDHLGGDFLGDLLATVPELGAL